MAAPAMAAPTAIPATAPSDIPLFRAVVGWVGLLATLGVLCKVETKAGVASDDCTPAIIEVMSICMGTRTRI